MTIPIAIAVIDELKKTESDAQGMENEAYDEENGKEIEETDFDEIEIKARIKPKSGSKVDNIEKAILLGKFSKNQEKIGKKSIFENN